MSPQRKITTRFCSDCNNTMLPMEDKEKKELLYACRHCKLREVANNSCVHVNILLYNDQDDELAYVNTDIVDDPTVHRSDEDYCPSCGTKGPVFFEKMDRNPDERMSFIFVCSNKNCLRKWKS